MTQIAIVGVGLIGGSLALALRKHGYAGRVVGIDPSWQKAEHALGGELLIVNALESQRVAEVLGASELIVLSMPVRLIREQVASALGYGVAVTDSGSTKREIVRALASCPGAERFVPGHPMAGLPEGGVEHARAELFEGRRWILCPEACEPASLAKVEAMVRQVGAEPLHMSAAEHDRAVALASHVPQVLASVLRATAAETRADVVAGPGFASATRVAGGAAEIWEDIFASNADQVRWALGKVISELESVLDGLGREPPDTRSVMQLLARARAARRESSPPRAS